MDRASPTVVQSAADVSGTPVPRTAALSADIYDLIVRLCISGGATMPLELLRAFEEAFGSPLRGNT